MGKGWKCVIFTIIMALNSESMCVAERTICSFERGDMLPEDVLVFVLMESLSLNLFSLPVFLIYSLNCLVT